MGDVVVLRRGADGSIVYFTNSVEGVDYSLGKLAAINLISDRRAT